MGAKMSRTQLQDKALDGIYAIMTYQSLNEEIDFVSLVSYLQGGIEYEKCDPYLKEILLETIKHLPEAVESISSHLRGWTFERLDRVESSILILAYIHYYHVEKEIDKGIVINIAVEQAKKYLAGDKDYKFVNAILDNILLPR